MARSLIRNWPWLVLALAVVPAAWHVIDFESDIDSEFPHVARPTFNRFPPSAYRLAEPGDTIDRVSLYLSAGAMVLSLTGWLASSSARGPRAFWLVASCAAAGVCWYAATPGSCLDGWHGLGWRTIFDARAPFATRVALAGGALGLAAVALGATWPRRVEFWDQLKHRRAEQLFLAAVVLVAARQLDPVWLEPAGYWPRWAALWGIMALDLVLVRMMPPWPEGAWRRLAIGGAGVGGWFILVICGIDLAWYHRPIARLRAVIPGAIYISAMPSYRGLELAHARHHFRTIVNLFPEDTDLRSPLFPDELRFTAEHGIRYVRSPTGALCSDAFLTDTLGLARDPDAWPILVHCHACQDRTPAWVGVYRFVVQRWALADVMREIERIRGYRPKASVTLLYNRVLRPRAAEQYDHDPTARLLRDCAAGTRDPFYDEVAAERRLVTAREQQRRARRQ
jgi:hypothetical protein